MKERFEYLQSLESISQNRNIHAKCESISINFYFVSHGTWKSINFEFLNEFKFKEIFILLCKMMQTYFNQSSLEKCIRIKFRCFFSAKSYY